MIAERIRNIRENENLSREKFAARIGVSRGVIENIELNRVAPRDVYIKSICKQFHVNEEWLRDGTGEMYSSTTEEELFVEKLADLLKDDKKEVRDLVMALFQLEGKEFEVVKDMVEILVNKKAT
ncbi:MULTISPECIES: helix-turn-helix domain-containing protein [Bacillus]|uniref:helix-turn-helix domain-containing protein n=1 Tax=Bacillus TaxID=1386 RepID=UPI00057C0167|nr:MULTISPECIES: helix-turn-helix transcriptional regulator [Bacillus]AUZ29780.1 XRE family transcriptional regulator [Bacillus licheniformis]MBZ5212933.1 helix-turn-helix transcriptional regulator [Bacillus paralicheniformis]MCY1630930.1 helix-turn-helix domain-containing protein [Bacillus paralicheniformis]MCY8180859.1 helix-turn-helix domain-containing protein [Bacillus paralicheniformis]MCY8664846.1 helix-turn-helix domain-containing protein [Bacillus haynesii]